METFIQEHANSEWFVPQKGPDVSSNLKIPHIFFRKSLTFSVTNYLHPHKIHFFAPQHHGHKRVVCDQKSRSVKLNINKIYDDRLIRYLEENAENGLRIVVAALVSEL